MRRPSVIFMNRVYPPAHGASGRVLRDLARSFAREGWQVTVITTDQKETRDRDGGIRVVRIKAGQNPKGIFAYFWVLMKMLFVALRQPAPHLLVTMSDPPLLIVAGQIVKSIKKCRHINWCHDLYPDILPALGVKLPNFLLEFFKYRVRDAMAHADKVIVVGRCMGKHLALDGMDPRHITVIPNWPNFELARPRTANGVNGHAFVHNVVNGFKPPEEQVKVGPKFRVLYAGNIGMAHPIDTILDAAQMLNDDHPEIEFVFVGDGPRFDELAKERSQRRLDNIRLMPYQPIGRLREIMESGDVHLISVKEEAAGYLVPSKLYSALAVGRPCIFIGPAQSETAKVITDFDAGVVVPQGDAQELVAQIMKYRTNGEAWYKAHDGAAAAGEIFLPKESINAWIERAWSVVEPDIRP